ncbi:MAG: thiamine pyrophosphate-dependent enzyme, partial [Actinomycetes bacterium]
VSDFDGLKQGAQTIVSDAKLGLKALTKALAGYQVPAEWTSEIKERNAVWVAMRSAALNPDVIFDKSTLVGSEDTDAVLTQGQLIGVLQEHSQSGDTLIVGAGGPPGDIQKVWDATDGRFAHIEFGFSCMGYELPAAIGVRLANPNPANRVTTYIGDGTFVMAPTELVTACQEGLPMTIIVSENHGYQVIRRLQMGRVGHNFGNEFRYREPGPMVSEAATAAGKAPRLEGDFLQIDIVKMSEGMGAEAYRPMTANEFRKVLNDTRNAPGPVVIVVPTVPHANLPASEVWWDVSPAEVSQNSPWIAGVMPPYIEGLATQRWHG